MEPTGGPDPTRGDVSPAAVQSPEQSGSEVASIDKKRRISAAAPRCWGAMPFLMVPALAFALGEDSQSVLEKINEKVDRASTSFMPLVLGLVGIALVAGAVLFFAAGEGLFKGRCKNF